MTIHLPDELASSIEAVVRSGLFATFDDAMVEAIRLLLREVAQGHGSPNSTATGVSPDPLLGVWRDAADEMDEIVADAMRNRRADAWRTIPGE